MSFLVLLYFSATFTVTLSFAASDQDVMLGNDIVAELVERINRVEALQQAQKITIDEQAKEIAELKALCKARGINDDIFESTDPENTPEQVDDLEIDHGVRVSDTTAGSGDDKGDTDSTDSNTRRAARPGIAKTRFLEEGPFVSFSVYLDHDVEVGAHQTIKFNQIITNEGGGYNTHTGVFTCPTAGVYMLAFFVGERDDGKGIWAELVVNSNRVVDAAVDTFHPTQDLQGGNMAIIRLAQGDVVWIEERAGNHVEGQGDLRLTTFSGVLIHP